MTTAGFEPRPYRSKITRITARPCCWLYIFIYILIHLTHSKTMEAPYIGQQLPRLAFINFFLYKDMYDCNLELHAKTVKQRNLSQSVPPKDTKTWLWLDFNPDSVNQKLHMLLLGYIALEVVNCMCKDDVVNLISVHTSVGKSLEILNNWNRLESLTSNDSTHSKNS